MYDAIIRRKEAIIKKVKEWKEERINERKKSKNVW